MLGKCDSHQTVGLCVRDFFLILYNSILALARLHVQSYSVGNSLSSGNVMTAGLQTHGFYICKVFNIDFLTTAYT